MHDISSSKRIFVPQKFAVEGVYCTQYVYIYALKTLQNSLALLLALVFNVFPDTVFPIPFSLHPSARGVAHCQSSTRQLKRGRGNSHTERRRKGSKTLNFSLNQALKPPPLPLI